MSVKKALLSLVAGAVLATAFASTAAAQIRLSEIRIDHPSTDTDEYFELTGPPGTALTNLWIVVLGDSGSVGTCGFVEVALNLSTYSIQADGVFCARYSTGTAALTGYDVSIAGAPSGGGFENSDNLSFFLVTNYVAPLGSKKLDTNNDGVLDITPWTAIVDQVGLNEGTTPNCTTDEYIYATPAVGPDGVNVPGHIWRCPDTLAWQIGGFGTGTWPSGTADTPGAPNATCSNPPPTILTSIRSVCAPLLNQAVTVTDSIPFATSATLTYKVNGGADNNVTMSSIGSNRWQGTIPGQAVNSTRISYNVSASNAFGSDTGIPGGYFVGTTNIAALRSPDGTGVELYRFYGARIHGNVTVAQGIFSLVNTDFWVQDATGGLRVFKFGLPAVSPGLGDEVEISGELDQFNGLLELENSSTCGDLDIQVVNPGSAPAPALINTCQLGEATEGLLVRLQFPQVDTTKVSGTVGGTAAGNLRPNISYRITNCYSDTTLMFVDADTDIDGTPVGALQVDVIGLSGQFDTVAPYLSNYQVIPRSLADIKWVTPAGAQPNPGALRTRLLPNAPNPFGGSTLIRYEVAAAGKASQVPVQINVYDVAGRRVATLVNELQDPGAHEVSLDASQLGDVRSGIFFYELQIDGKSMATRKLVVSR